MFAANLLLEADSVVEIFQWRSCELIGAIQTNNARRCHLI